MRLLADENFPGDTVKTLHNKGYNVYWVRSESPGSTDQEVLELARKDNRLLLTFDKDFGELAFRTKLPAHNGIILFRLTLIPIDQLTSFIIRVLESRSDWSGHFSVVEDNRIRMTALPK